MAIAFLWRWLAGSPVQRPDLHILLYTRAGCTLCDEAWDLLVRFQMRYGFVLETKNVDESAELVRAHGNCVPVVTINGKVRFRGHVNEVLLTRMLAAMVPFDK
jgi:glutaredoxin